MLLLEQLGAAPAADALGAGGVLTTELLRRMTDQGLSDMNVKKGPRVKLERWATQNRPSDWKGEGEEEGSGMASGSGGGSGGGSGYDDDVDSELSRAADNAEAAATESQSGGNAKATGGNNSFRVDAPTFVPGAATPPLPRVDAPAFVPGAATPPLPLPPPPLPPPSLPPPQNYWNDNSVAAGYGVGAYANQQYAAYVNQQQAPMSSVQNAAAYANQPQHLQQPASVPPPQPPPGPPPPPEVPKVEEPYFETLRGVLEFLSLTEVAGVLRDADIREISDLNVGDPEALLLELTTLPSKKRRKLARWMLRNCERYEERRERPKQTAPSSSSSFASSPGPRATTSPRPRATRRRLRPVAAAQSRRRRRVH